MSAQTGRDIYEVLAADWTDATGVISDVTGLSFEVDQTAIYEIEVVLACQSAATTTGIHWQIAEPGAGVTWSAVWLSSPLTSSTSSLSFTPMTNSITPATSPSATNTWLAIGRAMIRTNASASGSVKVRAFSEVAASTVTIRAGSFIRYRRLV